MDAARRRRVVLAGAILAYALVAAFGRPLTTPALVAVLVAGLPLCWVGIRRRPGRAATAAGGRSPENRRAAGGRPARLGARSAVVWLGIGGAAAAFELALWLGPDDAAHPTLSTLADPVLNTYPGRVLGYLLWLGAGAWLVSR